jgi:hypothetical protein
MAYLTGVGWCVYLAKEKADARAKELEEAAAEAERVQEVPVQTVFIDRLSIVPVPPQGGSLSGSANPLR